MMIGPAIMHSAFLVLQLLQLSARADVTAGAFVIDDNCLAREPKAGTFLSAVKAVNKRADACLRRLNPEVAADLAQYLAHSGGVRIVCSPSAATRPNECAHVTPGGSEMTMTRPFECGRLDNTIFHELLHLGTRLDDMTAEHHNDSSCRRYDAIYAAAELCFPSAPSLKKAGI
ncbi:MAG: hypothetical protein HY075_07450, partial [Deltaproteobacteria bacterium]|nr:hypothetical protein [Deltaproteobacteria bacterium]